MLSSAHFASHCYDDGCFNNEDVKLDLQHVEHKGLRLAGGPVDREKGVCLSEEAADDALAAEWGLTALSCASNVFSSSSSSDNIDVLPNEVLVLILSYLDAHQLLSVSSTCHRWRALAHEETLWKQEVVRGCRSQARAHALLKHYAPLLALPKEVDHERATGLSRWKSVWLAQRKTRANWRKGSFCRRVLAKKHNGGIFCLAADEEHIVTGSSDHSASVWNAATGAHMHSLSGHQYAVWNLKLLGHVVLSASYDSTVRLWNATSGKHLRTLRGHASAIWGLDTLAGKIVSSSTDTFIRLWDIETGQPERTLAGGQDTVWCSQFLDQNTIITGGSNMKIWDLRTNSEDAPVSQFSGHKDAIRCLQADSNVVVSGSYDSTAAVYDRVAGKRLWELAGHSDSITALQYDASGMLVTSSFDQSFRVWNIKDGSQMATWGKDDERGGRFPVEWADGNHMETSSEDEGGKVYALHFDEQRLITGREDGRLRIDDFSVRSLY